MVIQATADAEISPGVEISVIGMSNNMMFMDGSGGGQSRAEMITENNTINVDVLNEQGEEDDYNDLDALRNKDETDADNKANGVNGELGVYAS
jgi:hypothetical protein